MPEDVESLVEEIRKDNTSGASALAQRVVDVFTAYAMQEGATKEGFIKLAEELVEARPSMAAVRNAATECMETVLEVTEDPEKTRALLVDMFKRYKAKLAAARKRAALNVAETLHEDSIIITCSHSENVIDSLLMGREKGKVSKVFVMESRPLFEGRVTAKRLQEAGIDCELTVDAAGPYFCKECDLALVGADSVLRDGSVVNKVGTYPLAMACREVGIPFYVVCESIKRDSMHDRKDPPEIEEKDPAQILDFEGPGELKARNIYFDITPARLVTRVITEKS